MRTIAALTGAIIFSFMAVPAPTSAQVSIGIGVGIYVNLAPPSLPVYYQPSAPGPDFIWMPGYWAWGPGGYYWVPGTWVLAPQVGLYWTPGYWAWDPYCGCYDWQDGYWAPQVGFYGGINYGGGYYGNGYAGGSWRGNRFYYNRAASNVNIGIARNVYYDRAVVARDTVWNRRVSYNGGYGGNPARPTHFQSAVLHLRRRPMTPLQVNHVRVAAQDRGLLYRVNHGRPAVVVAPRPFTTHRLPAHFAPIRAQDRAAARAHLLPPTVVRQRIMTHNATLHHAAPVMHHAAPVMHRAAPVVHHAAPVMHHAAPVVHHAAPTVHHTAAPYHAPVRHVAPVYHAPVRHVAPVYHAPVRHVAPVYHAPVRHVAPVYHPAPVNHAPARHVAPRAPSAPHPAPHPQKTRAPGKPVS